MICVRWYKHFHIGHALKQIDWMIKLRESDGEKSRLFEFGIIKIAYKQIISIFLFQEGSRLPLMLTPLGFDCTQIKTGIL